MFAYTSVFVYHCFLFLFLFIFLKVFFSVYFVYFVLKINFYFLEVQCKVMC